MPSYPALFSNGDFSFCSSSGRLIIPSQDLQVLLHYINTPSLLYLYFNQYSLTLVTLFSSYALVEEFQRQTLSSYKIAKMLFSSKWRKEKQGWCHSPLQLCSMLQMPRLAQRGQISTDGDGFYFCQDLHAGGRSQGQKQQGPKWQKRRYIVKDLLTKKDELWNSLTSIVISSSWDFYSTRRKVSRCFDDFCLVPCQSPITRKVTHWV